MFGAWARPIKDWIQPLCVRKQVQSSNFIELVNISVYLHPRMMIVSSTFLSRQGAKETTLEWPRWCLSVSCRLGENITCMESETWIFVLIRSFKWSLRRDRTKHLGSWAGQVCCHIRCSVVVFLLEYAYLEPPCHTHKHTHIHTHTQPMTLNSCERVSISQWDISKYELLDICPLGSCFDSQIARLHLGSLFHLEFLPTASSRAFW